MIVILLIAAIFGFVLSTTLFFKTSTNTVATRILGSFYFLLSIYALHAYIVDGGYLSEVSWFFLWPLLPFHLLFIPIYYYYKVILTDTLTFKKIEFLLLVPFVLGIIDVIYINAQPHDVFQSILSEAISNPQNRLNANYWLLDLKEHLLIRHLWQFGVLIVLFPQLLRFIKKRQDDPLKLILNKWLLIFWSVLMFMALIAIFYAVEKIIDAAALTFISENAKVLTFTLYSALFFIGVIPVYFSSILHGYPQQVKPSLQKLEVKEVLLPDSKTETQAEELKFGLVEEEVNMKLESFGETKSYLNQNFSLTECARELEMPSHHISYFLKQQYGLSFAAYKNKLRMEHAKHLIEDGYLIHNTIEALACECGFTSRTSFSKTFKDLVDTSPSQYALILR